MNNSTGALSEEICFLAGAKLGELENTFLFYCLYSFADGGHKKNPVIHKDEGHVKFCTEYHCK